MSQDLPTYSAMTSLNNSQTSNPNNQYVGMHDSAELKRLQENYGAVGLGGTLDLEDDEVSGFLSDFGFDVSAEVRERGD